VIKKINVIGVMSGTSLDGLDIAFIRFERRQKSWSYKLLQGEVIPYPASWKKKLKNIERGTAVELAQMHVQYGHHLGEAIASFIKRNRIKPDLIASHGHTIFHQPQHQFTYQIGDGAAIYATTGIPVVSDFRSVDVALGGQGAPLVPLGDQLLFDEFDACLNLGGFANISFTKRKEVLAYDICPVNIVLNELAGLLGKEFDKSGKWARSGACNNKLLDELNALTYYRKTPPKSLGKEWVLKNVMPLLKKNQLTVQDQLRTFTEHIAIQIKRSLKNQKAGMVLVSGGGSFNDFLMEKIGENSGSAIVKASFEITKFKEAIIFGLLGVLRVENETNSLKSVTGARRNDVGGCIYGNFRQIIDRRK
jgi:anhydro-N-acetylmuramic acid kinase